MEFPTEFNIISPVRSCKLKASSTLEREQWVSAVEKAVEEHLSRRATFSKAAANITSDESDAGIGERAPIWVPDERVSNQTKTT